MMTTKPASGSRPTLRTRIEHAIDARSVRFGAWLQRRTHGRAPHLWHRQALVLTTRGRRSGLPRTVVVQFFPVGDEILVAAANSGMPSPPAWYLNLRANPTARVEMDGRTLAVRAEELSLEEAALAWPRVLQIAPDYARFRERTERPIALLRLIRLPDADPATAP